MLLRTPLEHTTTRLPGITLDEFILQGIEKGYVGPENAKRFSRRLPDECEDSTLRDLARIAKQDKNGSPEIIVVPLREAQDFRGQERAMACLPHAWLDLPISDACSSLDIIELELVGYSASLSLAPSNPTVFSREDHEHLMGQSSMQGRGMTRAAFVIRACHFDPTCFVAESTVRSVERHFADRSNKRYQKK